MLLVIEVKTELTSVEETLRRHDAKVRLAAGVVEERFGWRPRRLGRLLILPDASTPRRHVRRHDAVLHAAYPTRGARLRTWLRSRMGPSPGSRSCHRRTRLVLQREPSAGDGSDRPARPPSPGAD